MNIKEAFEALGATLENIADTARASGLSATTHCILATHDMEELSVDGEVSRAALIAGEITLGADGTEEKMLFECALSISDGEVSSDEMAAEIKSVRANVREICDKLDLSLPINEAFASVCDAESPDEDETPAPARSNKVFYITAAVMFIFLIVIMILIGKVF